MKIRTAPGFCQTQVPFCCEAAGEAGARGVQRIRMLLVGLALYACLGPSGVAISAAPPPRAERPTYSLGEKWIRDDGVYELIRIENDRYIFSAGPSQEIHLSKDLGVAKIQKGALVTVLAPPLPLVWPLRVGDWGKSEGRVGTTPSRITWGIDAYEDIQVAAGRFAAFRITYEIIDASFATGRGVNLKVWYSPEARQLVRIEASGGAPYYNMSLNPSSLAFQIVALDRPAPASLQVALVEPKDQAHSATDILALTGKATGGKGVARVTVTLNGQEVARQEEKGAAKNEIPLSVSLRLQEGKNVLLVTATDPEGTTRQEARTLFYDKPAPVPPPPVVATPAPPTPPAPVIVAPAPPPPPPFQLTLTTPLDQARVERESVTLAGLVAGGKGVSRVVVTLNGAEVAKLEERTPQRALPVNLALKLQEGQNTLVVTATEPDGAMHQEVRTVHYEKREPLAVAVRYPAEQTRLQEETIVLAAVVTSSKGVAKVSVTVNGVEVHQQTERTPQRSLVVTAPVKFREGSNALVVSASEPDGTVRQEVRTVFFDKPKVAVAAPPPPPQPTQNRWAVVVGVGRYESPDIPRLRYTVPDAEAIYQVLTGPAGFKPEHVILMTDKTERKPTLRNLKWTLGTFLARSAQKDDTVLIFFAGHGAPETDPRGIERDGLAKYLIPSDADPDDLYSTALPMDELQTIFGRMEAERVVVFLDACYSGAAGGRTFAAKKTRAVNVDDLFLERLTRSKGRAIITASRPAEVSIELPEFGHGLFTYYLLQGLQGAADLNRDGIVSLQELYEYVEQQVTQKSRALGANQHPVMKGELEGVLPLVKVKGP
ncbi:MAG: caspase family protein [candidate division NC10 bacterium]|nr:caspase family protein [candidate division NC10 bacterium]